MTFADKVVLITGGSSGIGRATAKSFAKEAAYIVITGRDVDRLSQVAKECRDLGAKDVLQIAANFTDLIHVDCIVGKVIDKFKRLDVLVNNAGIAKHGKLTTATLEDFDVIFTVNVKSMFALTQKAMPHLVASKGNIVNVSSICGPCSFEDTLLYGMSKAAVDQFTKTVSRECAPKGVRVNSVNPGVVKTNIWRAEGMTEKELDAYYAEQSSTHPIGRNGTAEDIAKSILFLASDDSSWTTGNIFMIDGGRSLTVAE